MSQLSLSDRISYLPAEIYEKLMLFLTLKDLLDLRSNISNQFWYRWISQFSKDNYKKIRARLENKRSFWKYLTTNELFRIMKDSSFNPNVVQFLSRNNVDVLSVYLNGDKSAKRKFPESEICTFAQYEGDEGSSHIGGQTLLRYFMVNNLTDNAYFLVNFCPNANLKELQRLKDNQLTAFNKGKDRNFNRRRNLRGDKEALYLNKLFL